MSTADGDTSTGYIPRREEAAIRDQVEKVRSDRTTRALLIYGPGGGGQDGARPGDGPADRCGGW